MFTLRSCRFNISDFQLGRALEQQFIPSPPCYDQPKPEKSYKKNLSKIDKDFMMNQETFHLVQQTIGKLEEKANNKHELDLLWSETKQIILSELDKLPTITSGHHKQNKKFSKGRLFGMRSFRHYGTRAVNLKKLT